MYKTINLEVAHDTNLVYGIMKKFGLVLVVALFSVINLFAQSAPKFYEISETFFSTPKTYKLEAFCNMVLGLDGVQNYSDKKAYVVVGDKSLTYKWPDGSKTVAKMMSGKEMLTVDTSRGAIQIPLYRLNNGRAVRAIKYDLLETKQILEYVYNGNIKKYIHTFTYTLE